MVDAAQVLNRLCRRPAVVVAVGTRRAASRGGRRPVQRRRRRAVSSAARRRSRPSRRGRDRAGWCSPPGASLGYGQRSDDRLSLGQQRSSSPGQGASYAAPARWRLVEPGSTMACGAAPGVSWFEAATPGDSDSARAENRVPDVADGLVQLVDGEPDAVRRTVSVHQSQRGLKS